MSLKDIENKLYGFKKDEEKEAPKNEVTSEEAPAGLSEGWGIAEEVVATGQTGKTMKKIGVFSKTTFWIIFGLFLMLAGFAYYFFAQFNKTKDLGFDFRGPGSVMVALPFEVSLDLENKSEAVLRDPEILIRLPEGITYFNFGSGQQIIRENLESMAPGAIVKKKYEFVVLKDEQTTKKINAVFSYLPPDLKTRFEKEKEIEINVGQPAININLSAPQKIFNLEEFETKIDCINSSDYDFKNVKIELIYPRDFVFRSSSTSTTLGNNIWEFDDLKGREQKSFSIKGLMQGPDQSFFEIKSRLYINFNQREYLISEKPTTLVIAASPLSLLIKLKDDPSYAASPKEDLSYKIYYKNNTDVGLTDVVIKTKLIGEMFNFGTLSASASFDSINKIITWNASNNSKLKFLNPGVEGFVEFSIKTIDAYPIKRMFDNNFVLKVEGEITSPTVPYNVSSDKSIGIANLETKIKGAIEISSSYLNIKGPYPPKADKPTIFEVKWSIKNYSNNVKDVQIKSYLQSGAKWLDIVKSDASSAPIYNERTGEVTWTIDRILATKGVINKELEATFQIEITPNITQINQALPILAETEISALDEFINQTLTSKANRLQTKEAVQN